ncbi:tRNA epoxyqueuosine(34) reductase QueG [Facilibium subflavum]|uniref:tRNA epoxyqueuosine(34) reductase QueG n=1 Tax=Facilibium subflavum TaxID=2219058 RepID=UPI000E64A324|nr:tRNA epoxyqueuosine(34) reductase QueG [Facilibium subflavum]
MHQPVTQQQWQQIKDFALHILCFSDIAATDCDLSQYIPHFQSWIDNGFHADLDYMHKHGSKRYTPQELVENTKSIIMVRLNYLPEKYPFKGIRKQLTTPSQIAKISYYAQGRDYHKLIRKKLTKLDDFIKSMFPQHNCRVFSDSAPVMEKPLAEKAGLGWIGKNSNLMDAKEGSFFFLGSLYSNIDFSRFSAPKQTEMCGSCKACIKACPTNAIVNNKVVDARRCISYLTIENKNEIPLEFRDQIGNRIYGCDDCQLVCPINVNAPKTAQRDFLTRSTLDQQALLMLFDWSETTFLKNTEGSAIRRIGYTAWLRNIAVALGNAPKGDEILAALKAKRIKINDHMLIEHIDWAIKKQMGK